MPLGNSVILVLLDIQIYLYYLSDASVGVSRQLADYIVFSFCVYIYLYPIMYFQQFKCFFK